MSIVFVGTPDFAVPSLRQLVSDGFHVSAVVTQPDRPAGRGRKERPSPVSLAASELGLNVLKPEGLRSPAAIADIASLEPEAIVAVAYGQILRQEVLDIPPRGVVNVHPSLLPRWRGPSPIPAAILAGDSETGVTIMLMDAGMDTGPVLSQTSEPIADTDTAGSLLDRLSRSGATLLSDTLRRWLAGQIEPRPQNGFRATTCSLLRKQDGEIDWSLPAIDIWRRVRAYNPWPGAFTSLNGEQLHIWQAWPIGAEPGQDPGTVVQINSSLSDALPDHASGASFAVRTGDGLLAIVEAQRAGRRSLPSAELLRGRPDLIGSRLGG